MGAMDPDTALDPARSLALVEEATERLLADATGLSDPELRERSSLPEWTRGHVLTHVARNADALINLFVAGRTGEDRPLYASPERRTADIEEGAGRPREVIVDDLDASHRRFVEAASDVTDWTPRVLQRRGARVPVWVVPLLRLGELEIHHTDLDVGYGFDRWSSEWTSAYLPFATADLSDRAGAPLGLRATDDDATVEAAAEARVVEGPVASLLAWVTGRHDGHDLRAAPEGPLPDLGPWR